MLKMLKFPWLETGGETEAGLWKDDLHTLH